jgi:group II intron reverse transcriptase/maturase
MQSKIATWTTQDSSRRIDRLLRLISNPVWLHEAIRITLASKGANTPGIDCVSKEDVKRDRNIIVNTMREELLSGKYKPQPVKRIYIPKSNGKTRPLGIPTLKDRIVQRAMLMAMDPIWESDFHALSYGFRPQRSVHHAIRTLKFQLTDAGEYTRGRWVIEGDLSSYFDTVHHRLLMRGVRKRINDKRFLSLLWEFIKAGHIDKGVFNATHEGVPQGGVLSPLLANIMLHEFDLYLEKRYIGSKARKDRWYHNDSIQKGRSTAIKEDWQYKPAVAYVRYADDFVIVVKGTKSHAQAIKDEIEVVLREKLKLTLNVEKTHITHVNDGFIFLGHRIIRKRGKKGTMRPVSTIPYEKSKSFLHSLTQLLSSNYQTNPIEMVEKLNQKLKGWSNFYQFVDFKSKVFQKINRVVFWKFAHWLARKYKSHIKPLMRKWYKMSTLFAVKTWVVSHKDSIGNFREVTLEPMKSSKHKLGAYKLPTKNPYVSNTQGFTLTSRYSDVAMAISHV